jgi:uncharacterized protein
METYVMSTVASLAVTDAILDAARAASRPTLRSLDAIHLATAVSLRDDLDAFVSYDERLAGAAEPAGIPVTAPR